ncbi:MAG: general stress protein [Isosphaeraceae bacterium]
MSQVETPAGTSIVAVYADHRAAEEALRQLHEAGFPMSDLSIIGRNFQTTEEPVGFISTSDYATAGAKTGASFGGLLGLLVGSAFLVLPVVGPVVVAGPLAASLLAGIEGALAGTALGTLAGALVGWGVPKDRAIRYETQIEGGKFIVVVRGVPEVISRARSLLTPQTSEHLEIYDLPSS